MKKEKTKKLISIICLLVVASTIAVSFVFRSKIEEFASASYVGVFIACFASTATILLPAPGILVVLRYAQLLNPVVVVLLGGIGTAAGEMIGYLMGRSGNEIVGIDPQKKLFLLFNKAPELLTFAFAFVPLPFFDLVGITAGVVKMNPIKFFQFCALGKILKMTFYVVIFSHVGELLHLINI